MKKILFVASEAIPFIKTGGLADVTGSLPKYFRKQDYDVRIVIPKYACMEERFKEKLKFHTHFYVTLGWRQQYVGILEAKIDGIQYYFIDNEFYFAGQAPYGRIYEDVEKFAFFSKAALEAMEMVGFQPDIIHCHDWQSGLVPAFLKSFYGKRAFYANVKTIFTIHNLKFQGRWMIEAIQDITGLPDEMFTSEGLESYGEANYLKGGVAFADAITTVSPTYAEEILTSQGGEGIDGLLRKRQDCLYGIINGLDYEEYNPNTDYYIAKNFNQSNWQEGKAENKLALQKKLGLPEDEDIMMIGMVSRMTDQKGFDLVQYIMEELVSKANVQLVFLGTGEEQYVHSLNYFAEKYPDKVSANICYSEKMAHEIYASADAFLMPSQFEPCGLSQLMSMRYGTVPIVRETGGLKDTVLPYNEYEGSGTGFSFANFNAQEMLQTIYYAMTVYYERKDQWKALALRGMNMDYSWEQSARAYEELYDQLMDS